MISSTGRGDSSTGMILAIDQGTSNSKAALVDAATGAVHARSSRPVSRTFPAPSWVEQDASELWSATAAVARECVDKAGGRPVVGLAISNQRESVVAWSRSTGRPLGPVIGWQDARTARECAALVLAEPGAPGLVRERTGLSLDAMFSAPKMRYAIEAAVAGGTALSDVLVGTVDAWLVWNLTGVHGTEAGNASRTLLLSLDHLGWDSEMLDLFGVPSSALAPVIPSDGDFGTTTGAAGLPRGIPVVAVLADSHAALYHHGCTRPGQGKATYGTGSSVMAPIDGRVSAPDGIATTLAWLVSGAPTYAREGNVLASGSALDWMATMLGCTDDGPGGRFITELATRVPDSGGVAFVPAFSGLGAPYWDRSAVGVVTGVSGGTKPAHLARAALEAVAHQVADVVEAIESDGHGTIGLLHADGGATASALLMQIQADLLGRPVLVSDVPEASALGAARLAAQTLGIPMRAPADGVPVRPAEVTARSQRRRLWTSAVARARGLPVPSGEHN